MSGATTIILHHYPESPFAEKVRVALALKGLPWKSFVVPSINVGRITTALTGGYRRIPVMQVGCDFYCDTDRILAELDRRFPTPERTDATDADLAFVAGHFFDKVLFAANLTQAFRGGMATKKKKTTDGAQDKPSPPRVKTIAGVSVEEFMMDRAQLIGSGSMEGGHSAEGRSRQTVREQLESHLNRLEGMLSDGRPFLLRGNDHSKQLPSMLDAHAYAQVWFLKTGVQEEDMFTPFPFLERWYGRVEAIAAQAARTAGAGEVATERDVLDAVKEGLAARQALPSPSQPKLLRELNPAITHGTAVTVRPDDYGDFEVEGALVDSSPHSISLERFQDKTRVHFPRMGYYMRVRAKM